MTDFMLRSMLIVSTIVVGWGTLALLRIQRGRVLAATALSVLAVVFGMSVSSGERRSAPTPAVKETSIVFVNTNSKKMSSRAEVLSRSEEFSPEHEFDFAPSATEFTGQETAERSIDGSDLAALLEEPIQDSTPPPSTAVAQQVDGAPNEFFGVKAEASHVVFVLDVSGSMTGQITGSENRPTKLRKWDAVKSELGECLFSMPEGSEFAVIVFSTLKDQPSFRWIGPADTLQPRSDYDIATTMKSTAKVTPAGDTKSVEALRAALALKPKTIFFLTDDDASQLNENNISQVDKFADIAGKDGIKIHSLQFLSMDASDNAELKRLAQKCSGEFRQISIKQSASPHAN